jgi:DNA-binding transcriptional LysR family regulator
VELRHLRYFVAVAEILHFRRAAEVLHIAQPALSQQIRQLEEEIGVLLFQRSHHKVVLTEAGQAFYLKAQAVLKDASLAVWHARDVEHGSAGTVIIGFVSTAAIAVLPKVLAHFRTQMPKAEVDLQEQAPNEQIDNLYRSAIDLGFFHSKLDEAAFESIVASRDRLIVALPEKHRIARRKTINLKDLAEETNIIPARHSTSGYFERVREAYQAAGIQPERVHHTRLLQTGLLLVSAGLGISLVPECFRRIRVAGVVYRRLTNELVPIELRATWRRDNKAPLLLRTVAHLKTL